MGDGLKRAFAAAEATRQCAAKIYEPPHYFRSHRCSRKSGHGPNAAYCKQHGRIEDEIALRRKTNAN